MSATYLAAAGLCFWSAWLTRRANFAAFAVLAFLGLLNLAWAFG